MKTSLKAAVAALVIFSTGSAFSAEISAKDIMSADQAAQGDVAKTTAQRRSEVMKLMRESGQLQGQIEELEKKISGSKTVRNVEIVVSAGLAVTAGLIIRKGNKGDLGDLAVGIFYGLPIAGLSALSAVGAGGQQVVISLDSKKLSTLKARLAATDDKLEQELAGLN